MADLTCCSTRDGVHKAGCATDNERQYYRCVSCGQPCVQFAMSMGRCPDCRAAANPYGEVMTVFHCGVANTRNLPDAIAKINRHAQLHGFVAIDIAWTPLSAPEAVCVSHDSDVAAKS